MILTKNILQHKVHGFFHVELLSWVFHQERNKFGSPTLRAAAGSLLTEPPGGPGNGPGRPDSGSSGTSDFSAPGG